MRCFFVTACASLVILLAGCSSAPKPEEAASTEPAAAAPAPEPAAAASAEPDTEPSAASPAVPPAAAPLALKNDEEKTIYAVGLAMNRQLGQLALNPAEMEILKRGLTDAAFGKPAVDLEVWGPKIEELARVRESAQAVKEKNTGKAYQDKAAAAKGAVRTASGLVYTETRGGSGASPKASDNVKVHYRGKLINGDEFDSSYSRNEPASFPLGNVIPCWTEGVQKMKVGGKAQLVCPSDIAYGDSGRPPKIPGGATLVFDVELLGIN